MDARQRTLVLMALAYLAAVAAGVNFYWTVSDTPLAAAMKSRPMLALSFRGVALGSLAALAAVASAPAYFLNLRSPERRGQPS
jgi:hypothetical protein